VQQLPITHPEIKPRTASIQLGFGPKDNRAGRAADAE
jgi:hypothetical protein